MPAEPLTLAARLRRLARPDEQATDAALLRRFVDDRDDAAFDELVRRYGPMVLGVCRRIVGNSADAEDACQAVFLILVRKARWAATRGNLAGWLHGVARNVARRAVRAAIRRRRHERAAAERKPTASDTDLPGLIDRELARLPEAFRTAVVLCDLEGLTRSAAAARLGCSEGTVASRLARGRQQLARRLLRVGLGAGGMAAAGELTPALAESIRRVATGAAASPTVAALTRGALRAMSVQRFFPLAAAAILVAGVGLSVRQALPAATAQSTVAPVVASSPPVALPVKDESDGISLKTVPPVVVKTAPESGAADVDPATTEIKVTFSKTMTDQSWSWSQLSEDTFPKPVGDKPIHYEKDQRTCVMKVKLEPGKTYAIWLNSEKFDNFKDADGRPAVPYLLVFQTKKAD